MYLLNYQYTNQSTDVTKFGFFQFWLNTLIEEFLVIAYPCQYLCEIPFRL